MEEVSYRMYDVTQLECPAVRARLVRTTYPGTMYLLESVDGSSRVKVGSLQEMLDFLRSLGVGKPSFNDLPEGPFFDD